MARVVKPPVAAAKVSVPSVNYAEELARQAAEYAKQEESSGGGQFFSVRGGILTFGGAKMPNNQVAVVIADAIMENIYYAGDFDPDEPAPPACYAFGRDEKDMAPHKLVVEAGTGQCAACGIAGTEGCCPMNEWASAEKGRGKACRNTRRLVLLPAGNLDERGHHTLPDNPEEFLSAAGFGFLRLPVTSVKAYANFVKQVAGALHLPPHGIYTRVSVVPDASVQFKVVFEPLGQVSEDLLPVVMQRHNEAKSIIETPYPPAVEGEPKKTTRAKPAARATRGRR